MTSGRKQLLPTDPAAPDLILLALFQSRLQERSLYLGQVIRSQKESADDNAHKRLKAAEQALEAVQQAQQRMGSGRYGVCDECEEPIAMDELLEAPEQTVCVGCRRFDSPRIARMPS